ncbi:MAG: hypothetical protein FJ109_10910 [Deltaproteobacteria bacterium]|nr:hypothetical protein [Deltaproteobacteria bacterium]
MRTQILALAVNDPLAMPCFVRRMAEALALVAPTQAQAIGIGRFELGEPLLAKLRQPCCSSLVDTLSEIRGRTVLVSCHATTRSLHAYDVAPFRYRNWLYCQAGPVRTFPPEERERLAIPTYIEKNIRGTTTPEVMFHHYLAFLHRQGLLGGETNDLGPLRKALSNALSLDELWFQGDKREASLVVSNGEMLLGASLERPVYYRQLNGLEDCPDCGDGDEAPSGNHAHVRGIALVDTDRLPSPEWQTLGPNRLFQVDRNLQLESFAL